MLSYRAWGHLGVGLRGRRGQSAQVSFGEIKNRSNFHENCDCSQAKGILQLFGGIRYLGVSEKSGTPKSWILGFSIINHPFWGTTIFGNTHLGNIHALYLFLFHSPFRWLRWIEMFYNFLVEKNIEISDISVHDSYKFDVFCMPSCMCIYNICI